MQNFYSPSVMPTFALVAQQPGYQAFVLEGPRYVPRNRSQQAIRLALHERLTKKPGMARQTTTTLWQRMAPQPQQGPVSALPFDHEDLRWGEQAGDSLLAIDKLAHECIRSTSRMIFFKQTARGWEPTKLGRELIKILPALSFFAKGDRCDLAYAKGIEMMFDAFVSAGLSELNFDNPQTWLFQGGSQFASMLNLFNVMGDRVRLRGGSASAGRAMQRHDERHTAKWREAKAYFAKIARRHPTCDIKRYELELPPSGSFDKDALFRQMHEASGIFVRSAKQMYGDALVGDARLIDRGNGSGYQSHVLLAFDGPSAQELVQIDQSFTQIWREQTRGGYLVDVNAMPRFEYRATGHLHRGYETSVGQLGKAAIYLARPSEIVEVRAVNGPAGLVIGETSHETKARGSRGRNLN